MPGKREFTSQETLKLPFEHLRRNFPELSKFTNEQLEDFKLRFSLFDKNGDGTIQMNELGDAIRYLGDNPSQKQLKEIVSNMDRDDNDSIDFVEFVTAVAQRGKIALDPEAQERKVAESFKVFDKDGNGFITAQELREVMVGFGERLTLEEANDMIRLADIDRDGKINYKEFSHLLINMQ